MFHSTRLKLTAWYLLIIMVISISFSMIIYNIDMGEMEQGFRRVQMRYDQLSQLDPSIQKPQVLEAGYIEASEGRVRGSLLFINLFILVISSGAGYFLAGRTLRPIKKMIEEQNRFIADASHELHTPLTAAKTTIEVGLRDKNMTLSDAKKLLESNLEDVDSMHELTNNLLFLAQMQNADNSTFENLKLQDILGDSIKRVQKIAKMKNIVLKNSSSDYTINGDKNSLIKVFVILLDNAIKYSPEKSSVAITSQKSDGNVLIKVTDQGKGINNLDIPNIFNRFYRSDKSRSKSDIPGYGLGLSIAKKIIDTHNGTISVTSKIDSGSIFTIVLPSFKK